MNPNNRINRLEVLLTDTEQNDITVFCAGVGIARAVFARLSMAHFIEANDMPRVGKCESGRHTGAPAASRASAGRAAARRRHSQTKCPGKGGAGGTFRVIQV